MNQIENKKKIVKAVKKSEGFQDVKNVVKFPEQELFMFKLNTNLTEAWERERTIDSSLFYYISFNCKLITTLTFHSSRKQKFCELRKLKFLENLLCVRC